MLSFGKSFTNDDIVLNGLILNSDHRPVQAKVVIDRKGNNIRHSKRNESIVNPKTRNIQDRIEDRYEIT